MFAPTDLIRNQLWVNIPQPAYAEAHPQLTDLVAALGYAQSIAQAAQAIALSPNAAYHALSAYLHLPSDIPIRRSISRWRALLSLQLCGAHPAVIELNMRRSVSAQWDQNLAQLVIGAELLSVRWDGQRMQLNCYRPGEAHRHLVIEVKSTKPPASTDKIKQLPCWARTIDWVDMADTGVCAIGLVDGSMIEVTSQEVAGGEGEKVDRRFQCLMNTTVLFSQEHRLVTRLLIPFTSGHRSLLQEGFSIGNVTLEFQSPSPRGRDRFDAIYIMADGGRASFNPLHLGA